MIAPLTQDQCIDAANRDAIPSSVFTAMMHFADARGDELMQLPDGARIGLLPRLMVAISVSDTGRVDDVGRIMQIGDSWSICWINRGRRSFPARSTTDLTPCGEVLPYCLFDNLRRLTGAILASRVGCFPAGTRFGEDLSLVHANFGKLGHWFPLEAAVLLDGGHRHELSMTWTDLLASLEAR